MNFKNVQGQLARWLETLQQYNFTIVHRRGSKHGNADALSRRPCEEFDCNYCRRQEDESSVGEQSGRRRSVCIATLSGPENSWTVEEIREAQKDDEDVGPVLKWLGNSLERPDWPIVASYSRITKILWAQWDSLRVCEGCLYREWIGTSENSNRFQLIVPKSLRKKILEQLHGNKTVGHFGVNKTLNRVKERFYWPQCGNDVKQWCNRCDECAAKKGPQRKAKAPLKLYVVGAPMERVAIDVMGPFPVTKRGNRYMLVAMDYFTKWPEAYPIPNREGRTVAEVLVRQFICRFGTPLELHADQGRNFESALIKEICELLGIRKTRTTPYHPQSDGMVERSNRTLATQLSMYVSENQSDWDDHIDTVLMAYRTAVHESTGQTPARLMMGHEIRIPVDLMFGPPPEKNEQVKAEYAQQLSDSLELAHSFARNKLRITAERMKNQYDVDASKTSFSRGDNVWLYCPQRKKGLSPKLQKQWKGPYTVVQRINDLVYKIQAGIRCKANAVHKNRLRRYIGSHPQTWLKDPEPGKELRCTEDKSQQTDFALELPEQLRATNTGLPRRSARSRHPPKRLGQ